MMTIRHSVAQDGTSSRALYDEAFPTEDLVPLVNALLACPGDTVSLVAVEGTEVVGHAILTFGSVEDPADAGRVALLGPLCVTPARQRQGIGGMLIRAGLECMRDAGVNRVLVLGDPAYYGRLGFRMETGVMPPFALPDAWRQAWQSLAIDDDRAKPRGRLILPAPWLRPSLWAP
ncbi:MAG: N-acetyltransferase [Hyphomicrobiaceae bacterium]|nr:N-acetyltransferase [Hyphomicrobiaceae bacterium]